ncbi:hypothetical protein SSPO_076740 [Streptomyces antimycoticus]|uniref:Uncharacterized protein n=1 Tax=Streptomyces antimycoticus TaxID=68175 RepID=A0A499V9M1_9ACTN|nr:hypothetical protein SSPO_076740 [Streptomyces antimycoticus]
MAALQGVLLLIVGADVLPYAPAFGAALLALTLLSWSFARDIRWLWRTRDSRAEVTAGAR